MLTVKCPHCQAAMKLQQAPASGKVKCPRCSQIVPVRPKAPVPAGRGQPVDPDDDGFDFGRVNFPSASPAAAVSHFPVQNRLTAYEGPIPGDPLEALAAEQAQNVEADGAEMAPVATKQKKKKMSTGMVIGICGGVGVLVIVAVIVGIQLGGSGASEEKVDVVAAAQATAPSGYQAIGIEGCVVLMPKGGKSDKMPSTSEAVAVMSDQTQSFFYMGAMNGGTRELTMEQMQKKAERQLGGDVLGPQETTRNGYKGVKGMLATSALLPDMSVEIFHVDERFVIIGCSYTGAIIAGSNVDHKVAKEELEIFFKSFKIGPKPSGWW